MFPMRSGARWCEETLGRKQSRGCGNDEANSSSINSNSDRGESTCNMERNHQLGTRTASEESSDAAILSSPSDCVPRLPQMEGNSTWPTVDAEPCAEASMDRYAECTARRPLNSLFSRDVMRDSRLRTLALACAPRYCLRACWCVKGCEMGALWVVLLAPIPAPHRHTHARKGAVPLVSGAS